MLRRAFIASLALLAAAPMAAAQAFPQDTWAPNSRQGQADEVPLSRILQDLRGRYGGQHVDARRRGDTYEIVWIDRDGRRLVFEADARSGRTRMIRGS